MYIVLTATSLRLEYTRANREGNDPVIVVAKQISQAQIADTILLNAVLRNDIAALYDFIMADISDLIGFLYLIPLIDKTMIRRHNKMMRIDAIMNFLNKGSKG